MSTYASFVKVRVPSVKKFFESHFNGCFIAKLFFHPKVIQMLKKVEVGERSREFVDESEFHSIICLIFGPLNTQFPMHRMGRYTFLH